MTTDETAPKPPLGRVKLLHQQFEENSGVCGYCYKLASEWQPMEECAARRNPPEVCTTSVACNCGATCILVKNRVNERWRPISPGWKYRNSEDGHLGLGWYCGAAGHEQVVPSDYNGAEVFLR